MGTENFGCSLTTRGQMDLCDIFTSFSPKAQNFFTGQDKRVRIRILPSRKQKCIFRRYIPLSRIYLI
ncbi:hypothetical protein CIK65_07595 [Brevibacterium aurantiacum]|uniref:Uncharacterized protein n=1 Tax=Brevibacterium aurantiacum TaxID=273384 RepID=A0A2A3YVE5_BREAU|nr:hypothetical protein CIK65_07595 [Brevibacterium aurantiacum]